MRGWIDLTVPKYDYAVLIDRDGVLNVDTHYPHDVNKLEMVPEVITGMAELSRLPANIIVVSNQGGIAQGRYTKEEMRDFNREIRMRIERAGGRIDAFYYCPHEEEKNLPEGVEPCQCSKPRPGMLLEAANDFGFDLSRSFMIGDRLSDAMAGKAAGATTIKVIPSNVGQDPQPPATKVSPFVDYYVPFFDVAAEIICNYTRFNAIQMHDIEGH